MHWIESNSNSLSNCRFDLNRQYTKQEKLFSSIGKTTNNQYFHKFRCVSSRRRSKLAVYRDLLVVYIATMQKREKSAICVIFQLIWKMKTIKCFALCQAQIEILKAFGGISFVSWGFLGYGQSYNTICQCRNPVNLMKNKNICSQIQIHSKSFVYSTHRRTHTQCCSQSCTAHILTCLSKPIFGLA